MERHSTIVSNTHVEWLPVVMLCFTRYLLTVTLPSPRLCERKLLTEEQQNTEHEHGTCRTLYTMIVTFVLVLMCNNKKNDE